MIKRLPEFRRKEVRVPVEQRANQFESESAERSGGFPAFNDAQLLGALKNEVPGAFVEIVARYQALLSRYARNFGIDRSDRRDWVSSLIHDVVLSLLKPGAVVPDSLAAYFARACRNKAYADHRAAVRRERHEREAATDSFNATVTSGTVDSESNESDDDAGWRLCGLSPGIVKLADSLQSVLTPDERELLDWSSEAVPLRVIADWLGVTRPAAAQRVSRLKQRLRSIAPRLVSEFTDAEQAEVRKFFQKANVGSGAVLLNARLKGAIGSRSDSSDEKRGASAHGDIDVR